MKRRAYEWIFLFFAISVLLATRAIADTLVTTTHQITSTDAYETTPTLGNDGSTDLVVYTLLPVLEDGSLGPGDIWYQPLTDGAPFGLPIQVTYGSTDDQLNDVSGDFIVYTAYDSVTSPTGSIVVYQLSTNKVHTLGRADIIQEPKIYGDRVVWREGGSLSAMVMYFELSWLGGGVDALVLAGPVPPTFDVQIGERFVVWAELNGSFDVVAYDFDALEEVPVAMDTTIQERNPATSGAWIVWQQQDGASLTIEAKNMDTGERVTIDNGAGNFNPSIDGDLITWVSDVTGNIDVWVYRISTGETFQVTTGEEDQYLNDVFGNMVAYVDMSSGNEDVYVSTLEFLPCYPDLPAPALMVTGKEDYTPPGGGVFSRYNLSVTNRSEFPDELFEASPDLPPCGSNLSASRTWVNIYNEGGAYLNGFCALSSSENLKDIWFSVPSGVDPPEQVYITLNDRRCGITYTSDLISTNTPPVSDAGPDQLVTVLGTTVQLDGTQSYDPEGDPITYSWTITDKPGGSEAVLSDATSPTPTFIADVKGTYEIELLVSDPWVSSLQSDTVVVSFENLQPVADAGGNQAVYVGDLVNLNGSGSSDANNDPLTYSWSFNSKPEGSEATLSGANTITPSFTADKAGIYEISLVVNDGSIDSEPVSVTVTATTTQSDIDRKLKEAIGIINDDIDPGNLKNSNMANALTNKLNAALAMIEEELYQEALDKLENDVLGKTDGCAVSGAPDRNDWLENCDDQNRIYPIIINAIDLLRDLIP